MSIQEDARAGGARPQGSGGAAQEAIRAIEAQQAKVKKPSHQWQVGEQLKDICRHEPKSAELIAQDLTQSSMGIAEAEKKIAAFARKNNGCVTGMEADRILREFYGLSKAGEARLQGSGGAAQAHKPEELPSDPAPVPPPSSPASGWKMIDPLDFL